MEDITFVVHKEWLDNIKGLPVEQQDKIIADFIRYGVEIELQHEDEPMTVALVNMLKNRIDFSKTKYEEKMKMAKKAGRKKKVDDDEVLRLAREGKSAEDIANVMGCTKTSIYHSDGWKNRKKI